jgi:hypothetical protein
MDVPTHRSKGYLGSLRRRRTRGIMRSVGGGSGSLAGVDGGDDVGLTGLTK